MTHEPGARLGKYILEEPLGKGGMAVVYRALDPILERRVAVKVMSGSIVDDEELKRRFEQEAKAVARLQHPNIVTVYDLGYDGEGAPYIAMELLRGTDLERRIKSDRPPSVSTKIDVVIAACRGLAHAHDRGLVHRDVKPANVFLCDDGAVKIMDFGVARWSQSSQTKTGAVFGTVDYMSPEQVRGEAVDGRSDVFSVGVLLYRLLSHRKPFAAEEMSAIFYQILNRDPPRLVLPEGRQIPELLAIIDRALAKDPAQRYQTATELAEALEAFRDGYDGAFDDSSVFDTIRLADGESLDLPTVVPTVAEPRRHTVAIPSAGSAGAGQTAEVRAGSLGRRTESRAPWRILAAIGTVLALAALGVGYQLTTRHRSPPVAGPTVTERAAVTPVEPTAGLPEAAPKPLEPEPSRSAGSSVPTAPIVPPESAPAPVAEVDSSAPPALPEPTAAPSPSVSAPPAVPSAIDRARVAADEAVAAAAAGEGKRANELVLTAEALAPGSGVADEARRAIAALEAEAVAAERASAVSRRLSEAFVQMSEGALEEAIAGFRGVLELDPGNDRALEGLATASRLKAEVAPAPPPRRAIRESRTELVAVREVAPTGFAAGGVEARRAGGEAATPGRLRFELNPSDARPGQPYELRIWLLNESNRRLRLTGLELVTEAGGRLIGRGQRLEPKATEVTPKATVLLFERRGTWSEELDQGATLTVEVALPDGARLVKSITW